MENYDFEFDLCSAGHYLKQDNPNAECGKIAQSILTEAISHISDGRFYLPEEFTIKDFDASYDSWVKDFLDEGIYSYSCCTFVDIKHFLEDNTAKIILG